MSRLTHLDATGAAHMVEVGDKAITAREAVATGRIRMGAEALAAITEARVQKGDVFATARIAGIMAAKQTAALIPLCHPIPISGVEIDLAIEDGAVRVTARCRTSGQTGVEMEAMIAVSVALLTIYDMAKALDRAMVIEGVTLLAKSGGRSGNWQADG